MSFVYPCLFQGDSPIKVPSRSQSLADKVTMRENCLGMLLCFPSYQPWIQPHHCASYSGKRLHGPQTLSNGFINLKLGQTSWLLPLSSDLILPPSHLHASTLYVEADSMTGGQQRFLLARAPRSHLIRTSIMSQGKKEEMHRSSLRWTASM
ncbi:hypothetical protein BD324DRAFT_120310 [Kockovaella imperatae]|uniref:Uncharacterized protein n=1 Tax=Kockovaella imperatae TaxID=4999 RepID=A0A1Y1UAS9_9TREE|nr:hypothetical protein BD324DRAFT_120310 [Kockovaella imperatae]ORX35151.1 hypothetical protein BD324DRAFT_120310 [Kockovaella imperatae]